MTDWKTRIENLPEEEKHKLAVVRVMECTNGIIQYAHRDNAPYKLSIEDTRRAMKFSMGCIKRMEIPMGDKTITFASDTTELFNEVRALYMSGAKQGNDEDYAEFMRASGIMINVLGRERILKARDALAEHITEIAPEKLNWGVEYMFQFIVEPETPKEGTALGLIPFSIAIVSTLCVIIAGYFHGHMDIGAVWHNLHNFN